MGAENLLHSAHRDYSRNQFERAASTARSVLELDPSNYRALLLVGASYLKLRMYAESLSFSKLAAKANPTCPEAYHNIADVMHAQGNLDGAELFYARAVKLDPNFPQAWGNWGTVCLSQGKNEEALSHYLKAIEQDDQVARWHVRRACWLRLCVVLVFAAPSPRVHHVAGLGVGGGAQCSPRILLVPGGCRPSAAHEGRYCGCQGTLHQGHRDISVLCSGMEQPRMHRERRRGRGAGDFTVPQGIGPPPRLRGGPLESRELVRHDCVLRLCRCLVLGACVLPCCYHGVDLPHGRANVACTRCRYKNSGRLPEAEESYKQALAIQPDNAVVMGNLAAVQLERGQPNESLVTFQSALALKPDFPDALSNMANALKVLGRVDEAVDNYKRVLELEPAHADALNNLANVYNDMGTLPCRARLHWQPACACVLPHAVELGVLQQLTGAGGGITQATWWRPRSYTEPRFAHALASQVHTPTWATC